jgi:MATE family multidrug resistance protein
MKAAFVGMVVNIILNYLLIYGIGPFPEMGISGAAIGTIMGNLASLIILAFVYFNKDNNNRFFTRNSFQIHRELFTELIRKGVPLGLKCFKHSSLSTFNSFISWSRVYCCDSKHY